MHLCIRYVPLLISLGADFGICVQLTRAAHIPGRTVTVSGTDAEAFDSTSRPWGDRAPIDTEHPVAPLN
jgi:hypothetical protein